MNGEWRIARARRVRVSGALGRHGPESLLEALGAIFDRSVVALTPQIRCDNGNCPVPLDGLARAWADLAQLAQRHIDKLFQDPVSAPLLGGEELAKPLHMAAAGHAEEARTLAQTTLLGLGGFGQTT